jgi:hypothetical protein
MRTPGFTAESGCYSSTKPWRTRAVALGHQPYAQALDAGRIMPALYAEYPCYTAADGSDGWCWIECPDPWDGGLGDCTGGAL